MCVGWGGGVRADTDTCCTNGRPLHAPGDGAWGEGASGERGASGRVERHTEQLTPRDAMS